MRNKLKALIQLKTLKRIKMGILEKYLFENSTQWLQDLEKVNFHSNNREGHAKNVQINT